MEPNKESKRTTAPRAGTERLKSPLIIGLGALLTVQLTAALVLGFGGRDLAPVASQGPLLIFDPETLTRIRIEAPGKEALTLEKSEDRWQIANLAGFPASDPKVGDLLDKIQKIEKRLPVGTSETAATRFKVASDNFERRVTLEQGKDPGAQTAYLGDSPGFRRLFVRADGEQAVYEAELTLFDASERPDEWTDKSYLHLDAEKIQRLELPDAILERNEGVWSLLDAREGEDLDKEAVDEALRGLANLDFRSVRVIKEGTGDGEDQPDMVLRVKLGSDQTREFRLEKGEESEDWVLKVSDEPYSFELFDYSAEVLTKLNRAGLLSKTEQTPPTEAKPEDAPREPASTTAEPVSGPAQSGSTIPGAQ